MQPDEPGSSLTPPGRAPAPTRREDLGALLLALCCAVLFLRDGLLPGRALVPHPPELFDVYMAEARAAGTFDPDDAFRGNVGMADKYLQSLCWDRVLQDRFAAGELPRWTRDIGGGAPFVAQMAQPWQPINALLLLWPSVEWYGVWYLVHLVLFGWFAYRFVRRLGCAHAPGLLALVAATLGMWTQCKLHHNVILTAALSLWPMLSATHALVAHGAAGRARRAAVGWLGLWAGLSWSTGFVVVALQATYLTIAWALFLLLQAPRADRLRRLWPVALGLALGAVVSLANMLPILAASAESARAATFDLDMLRRLGLEWDHLLTLGWPDLLSWPADLFYADAQNPNGYATRMPLSQLVLLANPTRPGDGSAFQSWVETSFAVGLVPLGACVTALVARAHRRAAWFFGAVALLAFGMACADQPFFALARLVPGLCAGDLRRLLFLVAMALVVLTGLGADAWLRGGPRAPARATWLAVALASVAALAWLGSNATDAEFARAYAGLYALDGDAPHVVQARQLPQVQGAHDPQAALVDTIAGLARAAAADGELANNRAMLAGSAWRALLVALVALVATWRVRAWGLWLAVAATVGELLVTGLGPVQTVPAERVTRVPAALRPVRDGYAEHAPRARIQRLVLAGSGESALPGNLPGFLGVEDANAYNPLPKARYEEFFECIEPGCSRRGSGVGAFRDPASLRHPLCDLYGIRFVLTRAPVPADGTALVERTPEGTGGFRLLERTTALPRATFVRAVDVLADPAARRAALRDPTRDVEARVVLEDPGAPIPEPAGGPVDADVEVAHHDDERVVVRVRTTHPGYLRLADPYDQGWTATLDGAPADVYVADHYLRAVYVPAAGEHEVVFRYDGARVVWPLRLTLLGYACVAFLLWTGRRRA